MTAATAPVAEPPQQQDRGPAWADAQLAAALLAVDPLGLGGAVLRAGPGPMRDAWLDHMKALLPAGAPLRRVPAGIEDERLFGGLDLAATLKAGRPLASRGVLAESDGGLVILAMAERLGAETAGRIAQVLDRGAVEMEREGFRLASPWSRSTKALRRRRRRPKA
jgi:magnesium chelatase subunit D